MKFERIIAKVTHSGAGGGEWVTHEDAVYGLAEARERLADLVDEYPDGVGQYVVCARTDASPATFGGVLVEILSNDPDTTARSTVVALGRMILDSTSKQTLWSIWGDLFDHGLEEHIDRPPANVGVEHAVEWARAFPYEEITSREFEQFYRAYVEDRRAE